MTDRPVLLVHGLSVWGGTDPQGLLDAEGAFQGRAVGQETETDRVPAPAWVAERLAGGTRESSRCRAALRAASWR